MSKLFTQILFVLAAMQSFAQGAPSLKHFREQVYLHTDKAYYYLGETVWFSAYMSYESPTMMDTLSKVLYVDLISQGRKIVKSCIVKLDSGRGNGFLKLPDDLNQGNYFLRAYTNWMRNYGIQHFFYKPIPILGINYTVREKSPQAPSYNNKLEIILDKAVYKKRELVKLKIHLSESFDQSQVGSFSISVTDEGLVEPVGGGLNIMKNYSLPDELPSDMLSIFKFPIERGVWLKGLLERGKRKVKEEKLTIVQDSFSGLYQVVSNDTGAFVVKDLIIYDTAKFLINGSKRRCILLGTSTPLLPTVLPTHGLQWVHTDSVQRTPYINQLKTEVLNEVVVTATSTKRQYENPYGKPDYYIKSESINGFANLAIAITTKIPGFRLVQTNGHNRLVWIRSGREPAVFIDNAQVMPASGETMGDRLYWLSPSMIDHMEVSSMISSGLGANGASGVIHVYSTRHDPKVEKAPLLKLRGFDKPAFFESPDYSNQVKNIAVVDLRSTIYWNPKVTITGQRPFALVTFFTSDRAGKYRVIVEGLENKKIPLHAESLIEVR